MNLDLSRNLLSYGDLASEGIIQCFGASGGARAHSDNRYQGQDYYFCALDIVYSQISNLTSYRHHVKKI